MEERILAKARLLYPNLVELFLNVKGRGVKLRFVPSLKAVTEVEPAQPISDGERILVPRRAVEAVMEALNGRRNGDLDRYAWAILHVLSSIEVAVP